MSQLNIQQINEKVGVGPQPTPEDLQALHKQGIRCIINFREDGEADQPLSPHEEGQQVRELGMEYLHVPIPQKGMKNETVGQFLKRSQFLPEPVYAHCQGGRRAAAVMMIQQAAKSGWNGAETLQKADDMGLNLNTPQLRQFVRTFVNTQLEMVTS